MLLDVADLSVGLPSPRGLSRAVSEVSFSLESGQALGLVGESGSGKTLLWRALLRLAPARAKVRGSARFDGADLLTLPLSTLEMLRGREIAVVFQDPMTSLNPVLTIGTQIIETLRRHLGLGFKPATARAIELLAEVGISEPERRLRHYPHHLSGGMRQRVAIAVALSCEPRLLIADEPTTALDVTVQAQILDLIARERRKREMALLLITHDLGVVASHTEAVMVMYGGRIVERSPTRALFTAHRHPYTEALLNALPRRRSPPHTRLAAIPGTPPDPTRLPPGCAFAPRCPYATTRCERMPPEEGDAQRSRTCWFPLGDGS